MSEAKEVRQICMSHVNVRLSVSFLVIKLVVTDMITAIVMVVAYSFLGPSGFIGKSIAISADYILILLVFLTFMETILTVYVVMEWLSEYYEISPYTVSHRRGVIFKKQDRYSIQNIKQVRIIQGVMGRVFNYGTIVLFDWRLAKTAEMYAVHNPMRYVRILEELLPNVDEHKSTVRAHIVERDEDESV